MMIIIPILATIFAIIYLVSPVDFLPEMVVGPIGLADDAVAILIAVGAWLFYFSLPLLKVIIYLAMAIGILAGLFYLIIILYKKAYGNKQLRISLKK